MRSDRRRRGSAGRRALSLLLVLMATLVALQIVPRPAPTPILATVPLHLDPAAAVDVVLDGRAGRLLVVNAGLAQAFDTRTGVRVYATRTGTAYAQGIESPPPVVDERSGRVYVPNLVDDAVYVFDGRSGRPLPPLRVGHRPDLLALDDRRGRLLVASTADWTLTVLDARTGVTLHTRSLDVGDRPGQLVADSGSGHTFVAGDGGQLSTVASGTGHLVRRVAPNPAHDVTALAVDARAARAGPRRGAPGRGGPRYAHGSGGAHRLRRPEPGRHRRGRADGASLPRRQRRRGGARAGHAPRRLRPHRPRGGGAARGGGCAPATGRCGVRHRPERARRPQRTGADGGRPSPWMPTPWWLTSGPATCSS